MLFLTYQFDRLDQGKVFLVLSLWRRADGVLEWRWKCVGEPRPLFGLDWLAANPDLPVIVCEREESVCAARRIFPDMVCVSPLGGGQAASKADWSPLEGRSVTIWPDADKPGAKFAMEVAISLSWFVSDLSIIDSMALASLAPDGGTTETFEIGWDAADAEREWLDPQALREAALGLARAFEEVDGVPTEPPRPLRRELSPAKPFPIDALGQVLGAATRAIIDKVQCGDAIAACSVLAAASLVVQAHADVVQPATGRARPLSLYIYTVAASGDRKSAADHEALSPIRAREQALGAQYKAELPEYERAKRAFDIATARAGKTMGGRQEIEAALRAVGDEPFPPLMPILTCGEPTLEGLHKLYAIGQPALGLFCDEGGSFIGGHAMCNNNRLRTVAGLSSLWDGAPIKRVRASDGASVLPERRLALHLMAQPDAAARLLSDPVLVDQGFLSRLLVCAPASTAGTRFQRGLKPETEPALRRYGARLLAILETPPNLMAGARNALQPRRLELDKAAKLEWLAYADRVEKRLASGGPLEPIRGLANKLPEHAARIAGVLAYIDNPKCVSIARNTLLRAIKIANFFATEARRLFEAGSCSPELRQAEKLLAWLKTTWNEPLIGLRAIYRFGPNSIRDAKTAKAAVAVLEDHGWLQRHTKPGPVVGGEPVREAWRIVGKA